MKNNFMSRVAVAAIISLSAVAAHTARAQSETISAGIMTTTSNAGAAQAGTITTAYVTGIFSSNNDYIQDSTGGIYLYKGSVGLTNLTIGEQLNLLTGGSFSYFATSGATQFQYATTTGTAGAGFTVGSTVAGTPASIPASYFTIQTTAQLNSAASQGSVSAEGIQNQLVTLNNVVITPNTTVSPTASATTFTSGATYTLTDSTGTATLFVNSSSAVVGTAIPAGAAKVSGVFQDYKGASEVLPRGAYDISAAPEPSTYVLMGLGGCVLMIIARRTRPHGLA